MISPKVHELQRRAVTGCSRCGRRTRDKSGTCVACKLDLPNPKKLSTERLMAHSRACQAELKRRREELDAALAGGEETE